MAAANAQVGVGERPGFPVFHSPNGGFEASCASSWFNAPISFWSVVPSDRSVARLGARYGLTTRGAPVLRGVPATYRKTPLIAYQEVEDTLLDCLNLADQRRSDEPRDVPAAELLLIPPDQR